MARKAGPPSRFVGFKPLLGAAVAPLLAASSTVAEIAGAREEPLCSGGIALDSPASGIHVCKDLAGHGHAGVTALTQESDGSLDIALAARAVDQGGAEGHAGIDDTEAAGTVPPVNGRSKVLGDIPRQVFVYGEVRPAEALAGQAVAALARLLEQS